MQKPTVPILQPPRFDYGLAEPMVRRLCRSWLHVYQAHVVVPAPPELVDPFFANLPGAESTFQLEVALLTDGLRGWLVLVAADDEWDAREAVNTLLLHTARRAGHGVPFVVRAVEHHRRPYRNALGPDVVDLCDDPSGIRLEAEFERHFAGRSRTPIEALLNGLRLAGLPVVSEQQLREQMAQLHHERAEKT